MSEPTTAAGRALLDREALNSRSFALITPDAILAIEREATAAWLASPEAVEEMRQALHDHGEAFMAEPESFGRPEDVAAFLLAALRDQRGAS